MTTAACPICGARAHTRFLLRKNAYDLQRCGACDHIFVHPQPSEQALAELYSFARGYMIDAGARDSAPAPRIVRRLESIVRHAAGRRLLDVGCEAGSFLALAQEQGFRVEGVEMNPDTAAIARERGLTVRDGSLERAGFADGSFDVVHLGDVIEHVPDVQALLREVARVLRAGGVLVVATPNHAAFFPRATLPLARGLGVPWSHATPPFHLHQFSERSLGRALAQHGFRVIDAVFDAIPLVYEIRATGLPSRLKGAVRRRDFPGALRAGLRATWAAGAYALIAAVDRLLPRKRSDASVTLYAVRSDAEAA